MNPPTILIIALIMDPPVIRLIITKIKFIIPAIKPKAIANFKASIDSIAVYSFSLDKSTLTPLPLFARAL